MFEIESPTKATLVDVEVLSQKNREPEDAPGAKLTFEADFPNDILSTLDPLLKGALYCRDSANGSQQGSLVVDLPDLTGIGRNVGTMRWGDEQTGYSMTLDLGLGGKKSNIESADCIVGGMRITPKPGGTVTAKWVVEAPNVNEGAWSKLPHLKGRDVHVALAAPVPQAEAQGDLVGAAS